MNPERKTEFQVIEKMYWSCVNQDHRHRTYETAMECIKETLRPKTIQKRWDKDQLIAFLEDRNNGKTIAQLARDNGMSNTNMFRLLNKAQKYLGAPEGE